MRRFRSPRPGAARYQPASSVHGRTAWGGKTTPFRSVSRVARMVLWPPNPRGERIRVVDLVDAVLDDGDAGVTVEDVVIVRVTSDEPDDGDDDGNTVDDVVLGAGCRVADLRRASGGAQRRCLRRRTRRHRRKWQRGIRVHRSARAHRAPRASTRAWGWAVAEVPSDAPLDVLAFDRALSWARKDRSTIRSTIRSTGRRVPVARPTSRSERVASRSAGSAYMRPSTRQASTAHSRSVRFGRTMVVLLAADSGWRIHASTCRATVGVSTAPPARMP